MHNIPVFNMGKDYLNLLMRERMYYDNNFSVDGSIEVI